MLLVAFCVLLITMALPSAGQAAQRFSSEQGGSGKGTLRQGKPSTGRLKPRPFGVLHNLGRNYSRDRDSAVPLEVGGRHVVTTSPFPGNLAQDQANERHREWGGVVLLGVEF